MTGLLNPSLLLALLLAVGWASLFHLWAGRTLRDLLVYLLAAGAGVALGQWTGQVVGVDALRIGQFYLLEATIGAGLALMLAKTFQL